MSRREPSLRKTIYLVSYPRSGSTLLRKYFSLLQGRGQRSVYAGDSVDESTAGLTRAVDAIDLVKSHQWPDGSDDVVYLVRDGRNATLSFLYLKFLLGNHHFSALPETCEALRYIDTEEGSWAHHVDAAVAAGGTRRMMFLKYEDLIARPVWWLQRLLEFTGTPASSSVLEQCVRLERRSGSYTANPNNGYLFQPQAGCIYDLLKRHRIEDYWRYIFDPAAMRYFHQHGGTQFLLHFGYETSADWWKSSAMPNPRIHQSAGS